jgi:hypothetical protein
MCLIIGVLHALPRKMARYNCQPVKTRFRESKIGLEYDIQPFPCPSFLCVSNRLREAKK